jgi:peptidoglycan/LPS O-acetylase OafA/YrhL
LSLAFISEYFGARWLTFTMVGLAAASFIFLALYSEQHWLQTALRSRFLIYSGIISYGLYLTHKIPGDLAQALHWDQHRAVILPVVFAGSYGLAVLSWNFLEKPLLRLKLFFATTYPANQPIR